MAHKLAGVDVADAHDAVVDERIIEAACGAPVAHIDAGVAHHISSDPNARGLRVAGVHTGVADVREGLHHDLAVVARIGKRLLIAGHGRGEHNLSTGGPNGAVWFTDVDLPIFEDEHSILCGVVVGCRVELVHPNPQFIKVVVPWIAAG